MNPHPGQRICVDMDEVIADAVAEHLLRYNRDHAAALTKADLLGKRFWQVVPTPHHAVLDDYLRADDFFAVLDVMPHAPRVFAALQQRYEVFIASAAMEVPTSFNAKFDWLARHFPFIPPTHIVFCGDKSILRADYLIDDNPHQLTRFVALDQLNRSSEAARLKPSTDPSQGARTGILYDAPHNAHVTGFPRVRSWLEIESLFLSCRKIAPRPSLLPRSVESNRIRRSWRIGHNADRRRAVAHKRRIVLD